MLGGGGGIPGFPPPPPVSNTDSYYISAGLVLAPPERFLTQKNVTLQFSSLPQYQQLSCCCHISSLPHCLRAVILSHHNALCTITFPPSMQVASVVLLYCCCHQQFSAIATSAVIHCRHISSLPPLALTVLLLHSS